MPWVRQKKPKDVADNFIELYVNYMRDITDAPIDFHEPTAMFMLAAVLDRRVFMKFQQGTRYPNVWILLLGDSTLIRKSTCLKMARGIMVEVKNKTRINQFADDSTPEGLIDSMSLEPRGFWVRDEVSGFFAQLKKKDYMVGMKELLIQIYDCLEHYEKHTVKKHYTLERVYANFIAGTTPKSFQTNIAQEDYYTGFLARWLVFNGEFDPDRWKGLSQFSDEDKMTRNIIVSTLTYIHNMLTRNIEAYLEEKTLEYYNDWCYDNQMELYKHKERSDVAPFYGRLEEYVVKLAIIYEVSNVKRLQQQLESQKEKLIVHKDSLLKAIKFIETYKRDRLPELMAKASEDKASKVYDIIKDAGADGVVHSLALRRSHLTARIFKECVDTLEESDKIIVEITKDGRKKKKIYKAVEDDA